MLRIAAISLDWLLPDGAYLSGDSNSTDIFLGKWTNAKPKM